MCAFYACKHFLVHLIFKMSHLSALKLGEEQPVLRDKRLLELLPDIYTINGVQHQKSQEKQFSALHLLPDVLGLQLMFQKFPSVWPELDWTVGIS